MRDGAPDPLPNDDGATLAAVLRHADPDRCTGCGLFHLIEALIPPDPPPPAGNPASHGARTPEGRPPFFHLGCDEAQPPSCPACRRRPYGELVHDHVAAFAAFVRERGARAMVWHDMLLDRADPRWAGFVASGSPATATLAGLDAGVSSYRDTGLVEDQLSLP